MINYTPPEEFQKSAGFYPLWTKNIGSVVVGAMSCLPFNVSYTCVLCCYFLQIFQFHKSTYIGQYVLIWDHNCLLFDKYRIPLHCGDPLGCITSSCLCNAVSHETGGRAWYGITKAKRRDTTHRINTLL